MLGNDLVAVWEVALSDGVHRIEFAHGTTSGKRVVYVNGKVRRPVLILDDRFCSLLNTTAFLFQSHCSLVLV